MKRRRDIVVTDHAVLRWLERVEKLDVAALRARLADAAAVGLAHGAGAVVVGGGKLILRAATQGVSVVTTLRRDGFRADLAGVLEIEIGGDIVAMRRRRRQRRRG